tara:strand:+ start:11552 stop:12568 length:1017 start_codon:yes stop_codon:yes gene_type:complete
MSKTTHKLAIVYNTCGLRHGSRNKLDNNIFVDTYRKGIDSILDQEFDNYRVVLSSCKNNMEDLNYLYKRYGDKISYVYTEEPHTVNITFNKAVQEYVKYYGEAEGYMYIDSGCNFHDIQTDINQTDILKLAYECFLRHNKSIISLQVTSDQAIDMIDKKYTNHSTSTAQITDEDLYVPLGKCANLHAKIFSNNIFKTFNSKIIPDVFAAYCTESTFRYLAAACNTKWYFMKDKQIAHLQSLDGPSSGFDHHSKKHGNHWNNLLYGRDANNFIQDKEFAESGVGYEEIRSQNILPYNPNAYDENDMPLDSAKMARLINKYFFLTKEELNYNNIKVKLRL